MRLMVTLLFSCCLVAARAAEPIWSQQFKTAEGLPKDVVEQVPGRGGVVHISAPAGKTNPGRTVVLPLPLEKLRGKQLFLGADIKIANVTAKPNPWNGVKLMLILQQTSGTSYPQPEIPTGTFDWQRFSTPLTIPADTTNAVVVIGLENVSGEAWFDDLSLRPRPQLASTLAVDPARPIFRGHEFARLRGAMAGNNLKEEDIEHFANKWHGNLLRLQIFESARKDRALEDYDAWLDERLGYLDRVLAWCEKYHVKAVVDLHSPPGGQAFSAGYVTARGRIFTQPEAQAKFIEVWQKMARRYKGRQAIWGFDLVNEPDDSTLSEHCLDWNGLADKTARAVREIDPARTLIIEPNGWGGVQGLIGFQPLDLSNVVYSVHFYQPMEFTHQAIHGNPAGVGYPGVINRQPWDKKALERAMAPAIEFARKYRVHIYVGEFSAIRSAPDGAAAKYLSDLIDIFETHGFDWSYHAYREWQGWSLEHEGPLDAPRWAEQPTDRQKVVTGWFAKNARE